ncbi:tyrosine-type recombinase/integrase [Enterobacter roggenkampii]|uniref:tyrosine-type recombinase/integrase n=1 Tax=Enterobacter roggenkampii TaxID=1812935 RepID=UPI002DB68CA5|nr:tyrosine-type recombinase/integrase [Enterobacter roggenkampii]MEB6622503.1 site-specific integrase [Enterobacter roggenkampii]
MMPAIPGHGVSFSATQLPVAIGYPAALALRQLALAHDELPKYLLAPEVSALLHYIPDLLRKTLVATLWNFSARVNEAVALGRTDFLQPPPYLFVKLATLKKRTEKAARTAGRSPAGSQVHRLVTLSDPQYVTQLEMMVATLKIPLERKNMNMGRTEKARIWNVTDRIVRTWLSEAVEADGVTFSVQVTPHTFRHCYAMHMIYAGIPLMVLQSLMVQKSISLTEVGTDKIRRLSGCRSLTQRASISLQGYPSVLLVNARQQPWLR